MSSCGISVSHVLQAHPFLDRKLQPDQSDAGTVLDQLADCTDPPIAEVVDVIDLAVTVLQFDQVADDLEDVLANGASPGRGHVHLQLVVSLSRPTREGS